MRKTLLACNCQSRGSFCGVVATRFHFFASILSRDHTLTMLVLFETAAGFALFKVLDESKLKKVDSIHTEFQDPESANQM
jgi:hypothetical protein